MKYLKKTNMKGILHKTEQGWIVIYDEIIGENIVKKNQNSLPLHPDSQTWMDGYNLYEGKEVEFEIVIACDNNGPDHFPTYAKTIDKDDLSDWDITLNDGLENEPYVSDDFQIGPDGAYEHTEEWNTSPREKASELIINYQTTVTSLDYNEAKQCALVMVDEIKRILYDQDLMIRYDYWFEVEKEIEKL
jgi:hypothetical protein